MTARSSELAFLFRTLKAPAAALALPKLAERARAEEWSYERFAEALLQPGSTAGCGWRRVAGCFGALLRVPWVVFSGGGLAVRGGGRRR
jgi:hypothetical protein